MTSSTEEDSKADACKPLASGDSPTEEMKPKEPKSEEVEDSTQQVKEEPLAETDDINVFGDDDSKDGQDWVASQEAIKEVGIFCAQFLSLFYQNEYLCTMWQSCIAGQT